MTRATEDALGSLHSALAMTLAERIASGLASAADLAVAAKFLKDNNITATAAQSEAMEELERRMAEQRAKRGKGGLTLVETEEIRRRAMGE